MNTSVNQSLYDLSHHLQNIVEQIVLGDHFLHFEHQVDGGEVAVLVYCSKCNSEIKHSVSFHTLLKATSREIDFIEMTLLVIKTFEFSIPISCVEAKKLTVCKEVLDE